MDINLTPIIASWPFLAKALGMTIFISVMSTALGFVIGVIVGALRTYGGRAANIVLGFYVDSMRAIPLLVILVWTFFAFPLLIGSSINAVTAGIAGLGLHLGAYVSETIRAGLTSVRRNQMQAALALGMSRFQAIKTIILPQAVIRMLPALGSLFVIAIKDSAIASVIAVPELLRQTQIVAGKTFRPFELYTAAMLAYFVLCYPVARGVDRLYRRLAHLGSS
ncbi:amino acid ABC transporter permease [Nordella sp. HKS 07]|uniref:amino acid ABC transporter permease n=1 Tax=Nordella sp. HKS 07 TaxID=2712222 RepID=UPI0013E15828|nr:amino acid ABC transporter permease [Nordella sp. HKS 07]QIG48470.1 amino acid ABC transporter permease [Nordella sp. HKS 07]